LQKSLIDIGSVTRAQKIDLVVADGPLRVNIG
jgi:hypothetical protein